MDWTAHFNAELFVNLPQWCCYWTMDSINNTNNYQLLVNVTPFTCKKDAYIEVLKAQQQ